MLTASLLAGLAALLAAPGTALAAAGDPMWEQTETVLASNQDTSQIAVDSTGLYITGGERVGASDTQWRIVKRDLTDGSYISTFGTSGVVTFNPSTGYDFLFDIAVDSTGIYLSGSDSAPGAFNSQWRIEKRRLDTGALCTAANCGTAFGAGGAVTFNDAAGYDYALNVAVDSTGLYVLGSNNRLRKLNLTTGGPINSFGSSGVVTTGFVSMIDMTSDIVVDASGIYIIGQSYVASGDTPWRIEKRDPASGNLFSAFGSSGVVTLYNDGAYWGSVGVGIAIDTTGLYTATYEYDSVSGYFRWHIEKRDLTTGAPIPAFGSGGVITYTPSSDEFPTDMTIDSTGIYIVGTGVNRNIEKRSLTDGSLIWEKLINNQCGYAGCSPSYIAADSTGIYGVISTSCCKFCCVWKRESGGGAPPPPPPTVNLSAAPPTINEGESSTLTWTSTDATSCAAVSPAGWTSQTGTSGAEVVWPAATETYILSCTGPGGTTQQSTTVTVNPPCTPGWASTAVDSTDQVGSMNSIAIGADGLPVISYFDGTNGNLKVAKCGNAACNSGNTLTTVDATASLTGYYTSIAIGTDGFPVIFYYDWTNSKFKVAKCGDAGCTSGNTLTVINPQPPFGFYNSIAIGADGLPVISCDTNASRVLNVIKCGNASCTSGNTLTTVDSTGVVGFYNSIAIGIDSLPVISYLDSTNLGLKVAKCGDAACTSGNTFTIVDSTGSAGSRTSIAIGTDGLPVISYEEWTNHDLKVAKCGDIGCTSGNILTTVDSASYVDYDTSIAVGPDGLPVISYLDGNPNYDIKVAKCGNASCTAGNTLTTVDSAGTIGAYHSIAISTDGLPVISYYDQTNGDLKVAKEDNCTGGTPLPTITLDAAPPIINGGETSKLTWTSSGAASCAAISPAGWITAGGGDGVGGCDNPGPDYLNGCQVVQPSSTTVYIIECLNALGDPAQQSVMVTVNAPPSGNDCGLRMYDGTATVTLTCEDPPVSPLRIRKGTTTYGISVVDPADPNASRIRIQTPAGIKALRKQ
ncbi:MAG: hypothetical protein A3D87_07070 [Omnitrophica WOR_2 bacterium RIFCSPHIGHO2_02_FULL_50_17]|nr:MAG: hypothetical protein A3D87_07070 [Omnitrophica WOR_2 bacterium RIFCSPHIGHO2_02_FULL_50_17]